VIAKKGSDFLDTPIFHAGETGEEETVALFTNRERAQQYLDRAGWGAAEEVGVLRPGDQQEWFETAREDGVRWVVIDPDHDRHLAGDPQPVEAIEGDLTALAQSIAYK